MYHKRLLSLLMVFALQLAAPTALGEPTPDTATALLDVWVVEWAAMPTTGGGIALHEGLSTTIEFCDNGEYVVKQTGSKERGAYAVSDHTITVDLGYPAKQMVFRIDGAILTLSDENGSVAFVLKRFQKAPFDRESAAPLFGFWQADWGATMAAGTAVDYFQEDMIVIFEFGGDGELSVSEGQSILAAGEYAVSGNTVSFHAENYLTEINFQIEGGILTLTNGVETILFNRVQEPPEVSGL